MNRPWCTAVLVMLVVFAPALVAAQPPAQCFPDCRPGFLCSPQGQCVSACNPPCASGELCSPSGECVSACNPPCGAGQTCSDSGQCVGSAPPAQTGPPTQGPPQQQQYGPPQQQQYGPPQQQQYGPPQQQQYGPPQQQQYGPPQQQQYGPPQGMPLAAPMQPADPGWARAAGIFGIVSASVVGILAIGAIAADDADVSIPVGAVATTIAAITAPIVAVGAGSARGNPQVRGSPGLRVTAWIAYGLGILDAVTLLALGASEVDIPPAASSSVAALVVMSIIFHAIDAFGSAAEAEALGGAQLGTPSLSLTPLLGIAPNPEGGLDALLGLHATF